MAEVSGAGVFDTALDLTALMGVGGTRRLTGVIHAGAVETDRGSSSGVR
jgi:hypothetical protein